MTTATATQAMAYYAGVAGIVFGVGIFAWGITFDGAHWWRAPRQLASSSGRWIPLHEAIRYIAYESRWAWRQPSVANSDEFDARLVRELREFLARGDVAARGKPYATVDTSLVANSDIPREAWINAGFQPAAEIWLADNKRGAIWRTGESDTGFIEIEVDGHAVRTAFPPRWPSFGLRGLSPFARSIEPMRQQFIEERNRKANEM